MIVNDKRSAGSEFLPKNPTYEQARDYFGFRHVQTRGWDVTQVGEACWKMIGITIYEGIVVYRPLILDLEGDPLGDIAVFRHYPGAPQFPVVIHPEYYTSGNYGMTGTSGDKHGVVEFDSHIIGSEGGPDSIWASSSPNGLPPQHADMIEGLGWMGGTNHVAVSPIFQWVVKSNVPPQPGKYRLVDMKDGVIVKYIDFVNGPPPAVSNVLGLLDGNTLVAHVNWTINEEAQ